MQMTKSVSLNRPWSLNRSPHEIEPLGTTGSTLRSDRTYQSGWPDACHPASGHAMRATWPLSSMLIARSQRSNPALLSKDRTRRPAGPDAPVHGLLARQHAMTWHAEGNDRTRHHVSSGHLQRAPRALFSWPDAVGPPWSNARLRPLLLLLVAHQSSNTSVVTRQMTRWWTANH
jgi:hypothetical protein